MTEDQLLKKLLAMVEARKSQVEVAKEVGISQAHLSEILAGKKRPGADAVLKYFGRTRKITFPKAIV